MGVGVPSALIGREVSVRALVPLWEAIRTRGIDPERLADGASCHADLTDPSQRISWAAYSRIMSNLGELLEDDELVALGASALDSPRFRALVLPGRLLFGATGIYRWMFGPTGPASQLIVCHEGRIVERSPGWLQFDTRMKPGYPASRENYLLLRGTLMGLSRALGVGSAEVTHQSLEDGALYDIRVPHGRGAVGFVKRRLSWVFDARSTAEELRRAHLELNDRYVELRREIERRIEVEAELRRLNDELEKRVIERTAALESFSYSVSHDLRTPLRTLVGFSQALLEDEGARLGDRGRDYLRRIGTAAMRMGDIIDGLLQLSRVTRAEFQREAIDLTGMARLLAAELLRIEPERDIDFVIAEGLTAQGDARLVRIALQNLIDNAWKFTRKTEGARLEIAARVQAGAVVYYVRDNGAGFDMKYAAKLFEPFSRLHRVEAFPGSGIGLATVRRVVERHEGRVWAEATPEKGATFFFTLAGTR